MNALRDERPDDKVFSVHYSPLRGRRIKLETIKSRLFGPVAVVPPVYELPVNHWRWCNLKELCAVVPGVAALAGLEFSPSPESLVRRFAGLTRPNKEPDTGSAFQPQAEKKVIFRFSRDGLGFSGTEVPLVGEANGLDLVPPFAPFILDVGMPYAETLFVREDWATDTLAAIRKGVVATADLGEGIIVGMKPNDGDCIHLGARAEMILFRIPKGFDLDHI